MKIPLRILSLYFSFCLLSISTISYAQSIPPLNANAWNFIFVQSFEQNQSPNNTLSIQGFNHSLLFGQLLNSITAGKARHLRQIYALTVSSNASSNSASRSLTPLQSIEPYAVLANLGVVSMSVSNGDKTVYNSPAYIISNILGNQPHGIYVISMSADLINSTINAMVDPTNSPDNITPGNYHQYAVLTVENGQTTVTTYDDALKPAQRYPDLHLSQSRHYQCPQNPVTLTAKNPHSSKFQLNTNQTVHFVRHVEAHPTSIFENGNYVCQGEWRAIGATDLLRKKIGGIPSFIFSSNPTNLIQCDAACSYIRPSLTISPFAMQHHKPIDLAAFQWDDAPSLAASLFSQNSPYSNNKFNGSSVLVAWEHAHIEAAIKYLMLIMYDNAKVANAIPAWSYTDYDTIWTLSTDNAGNITFSNSCEGIDSNTLPSTCPAFFEIE